MPERTDTPLFEILSTCKGGGYRYCRTDPPHPRRNTKGQYPLHIVLMENKLGRMLEPHELVHHKDEDKTNDDPANLEVLSRADHTRHHKAEQAPPLVDLTCHCGAVFQLKPHIYRLRAKNNSRGVISCSRRCSRARQFRV